MPRWERNLDTAVDYALSRECESWLRHPVYGDPSFDSFERVSGNPIHRGAPPFEWPVNGFFFPDPVSGSWYIYVGDYSRGYHQGPSRCILYRSQDQGRSWQNLGVVLAANVLTFGENVANPDVSVVYDGGRYHMLYDWGEHNPHKKCDGGLAYAWADKPEGPFQRASQPITRNFTLPTLLGRYQRTYAATLIRRKTDWLIVGMMDHPPQSWVLFAMTSANPAGPYSDRQLLLHVEADSFYPPLMEFFPAFVHDGFLFAPATSVALNRNFNMLYRAPLERATEPGAWEIVRHGSVWHAEDVENEALGIWGQTIAGWVDVTGRFWAMFNSRDSKGVGTVNLACRSWNQPLRACGFVLSGHRGASLTCLRRAFRSFKLEAKLRLRGTVRLLWDYRAPLGPNVPESNSTLHPLMYTRHQAVELTGAAWRVIRTDADGHTTTLAAGTLEPRNERHVMLDRRLEGSTVIAVDGQMLWEAPANGSAGQSPGVIGLLTEPNSHLAVEQFQITGHSDSGSLPYLWTEALLGAGENATDWDERKTVDFRYGTGLLSRQPNARAKWNVVGTRATLWAPRAPDFGAIEILVDGCRETVLDLHAEVPQVSCPVWTSRRLSDGGHAVVLRSAGGVFPVDSLEVES